MLSNLNLIWTCWLFPQVNSFQWAKDHIFGSRIDCVWHCLELLMLIIKFIEGILTQLATYGLLGDFFYLLYWML